ncbi:MAG: hypothetical protein H7240_08275 [Glaciimonas sp.]|nr:hypothetical protein [Glaciimonas sp.]
MKLVFPFVLAALLFACSSTPPLPPAVRGEYRPVNTVPVKPTQESPTAAVIDISKKDTE